MEAAPEFRCMELTIFFLRSVGCWPNWRNLENAFEKCYVLYTVFMVMVFIVYVIILTSCLPAQYEYWTSMSIALQDMIVYGTGLIVLTKILMLVLNQWNLQEIIDYINEDLNRRRILTPEDRNEILSCVKHEKTLTKYYFSIFATTFFLFLISSLTEIIMTRPMDDYSINLPLRYSFKITQRSFFVIVYIHQIIVMILLCVVGCITDTFFSSLVYYLCGHLRLIQNLIGRLGKADKTCIDYHREIIRLIERLEEIYRPFLIFMFSINSLMICCGLFQVVEAPELKFIIFAKFFGYSIIKISQMLLYCGYGQEIMERNVQMGFVLYSTNWYQRLRRDSTRDLMYMLHRTQKPIHLKAGSFFLIGLPMLRTVVNSSYSYFTLFRSFRK